MRKNWKLMVAWTVCLSPFALVAVKSMESFLIFAGIMAVFLLVFVILIVAHWAVETVLVTLGFDKNRINEDRSSTTFIFWGGGN